MKVRAASAFYYPDVVLTCLPLVPDALFVTGARLIVEVLSESTQGRDRLEKLIAYRSLESLPQYVLVAQEETAADVYRRAFDG
jgi:Uma2 family endonuclease